MFNRSFGVLVVLAVLGLSAISLGATYGGGSGTAEDPYQIWTAEQMNTIGANSADWDKHFKLMDDIDMSAYTGVQYNIIGNSTRRFIGTFDGGKHIISNLTYSTTEAINYVGLFGYTYNAIIKNLRLDNAAISSGGYLVGCLVGRQEGGSVINCYTTGTVASITEGTSSVAGGLVGSLSEGLPHLRIENHITNCFSTVSVICSSRSSSTSSSSESRAGGLVGVMVDSRIANCYSTGPVTADCISSYQSYVNAGGLVGLQVRSSITNCYSTGFITAPNTNAILACYAGGLVGGKNDGTITGSFWDVETSGKNAGIGSGSAAGLTGKTTAEMKTLSTFQSGGWDFSATDGDWYMPAGSNPLLKWMQPIIVPDVVGMSMANAPSSIVPVGLFVNSVDVIYSDSIAEGTVLSQSPDAGQTVLFGTGINLVISLETEIAGCGTAQDPYRIWTPQQFNAIGANPADWGKCFKLMADIDLSAYAGTRYNRIGNSTNKFTGIFDGNYHTIRNLTYTPPSEINYIGLFGYTCNSTIRNLSIENISISSYSNTHAGGLVGLNEGGAIHGCYVSGSISSTNSTTGGLAGWNNKGKMTDCLSSCSVVSENAGTVGGLVGWNTGRLVRCGATGSVRGQGRVGGLVGQNQFSLLNCYASGSVAGSSYVGGLVGENLDCGLCNCYATGTVTATGTSAWIGGLAGRNYCSSIVSCYATGSVTGGQGCSCGGLIGYNDSSKIIACYATGSVSGTTGPVGGLIGTNLGYNFGSTTASYAVGAIQGISNAGGLIGDLKSGPVSSCFWDVQTSGKTIGVRNGSAAGVTGKTTLEMKTRSTFISAGWDFINFWAPDDRTNYPRLLNLIVAGDWVFPEGVGTEDIYYLAQRWLMSECGTSNDFCEGADINQSSVVDLADFTVLAEEWLQTHTHFVHAKSVPAAMAQWKMDETEGAVVADSIGQSHGQAINMTGSPWMTGYEGNALQFDGVDDYVEVSGVTGISGTASRTCMAWIKTSNSGTILSWGGNNNGRKWSFCPYYGRLGVSVSGGIIYGNTSITDDQWHHVAAVLVDDGSPSVDEIKLYVDGVLQKGYYDTTQAIDTAVEQNVQIGSIYNGSSQANFFKGLIDDVRIYDTALTMNQIVQSAME